METVVDSRLDGVVEFATGVVEAFVDSRLPDVVWEEVRSSPIRMRTILYLDIIYEGTVCYVR